MISTIFILLVIYQLKHFICDYPLQVPYMLGKFLPAPKYILPLLAHVAVHGAATFLIALMFKPSLALSLAVFDMVVHFIMDRIKASPDMLGRFKPLTKETYPNSTAKERRDNVLFWWSLGLDQGVHHLTHYAIIGFLL